MLIEKKHSFFSPFLVFIICMWVVSCAQMVAPTGGPKDETAPKVLRFYPVNKTTHFKAPKIIIQFDEYIVLNNPNEQVIISPPLDTKPEITIDHKKVIIDLKKQVLRPTKTYTINFGNAIGDLHENNKLQNQTYVFCTGAMLDSLNVSGFCLNAFNNSPEKAFLVGLYNATGFNDSTIYKERPVYFTKSHADGAFLIENIPGTYFNLLAFNDENGNLKYDKNESIGFLTDSVLPGDTLMKKISLFTYKPDPYERGRLMDTFSNEPGRFTIVSYKPLENPVTTKSKVLYTWFDHSKLNLDTFVLYTHAKDSFIHLTFQEADSLKSFRIKTRRSGKKIIFNYQLKKNTELNDTLLFTFNSPAVSFDTSRIILKQDTVRVKPKHYSLRSDGRSLLVYYPWQESTKYSLEIKDSAFTNYSGVYSRTPLKQNWVTKALKDYCSLKLSVINDQKEQIIMQLLNESESLVYKEFLLNGPAIYMMDYLIPGTYKIKFIKDKNKNGVWDNGIYKNKLLAEQVYYFSQPMVLRAYWDIEQTIDLSELIH